VLPLHRAPGGKGTPAARPVAGSRDHDGSRDGLQRLSGHACRLRNG
jgi:hypothetical protein